MSRYDRDYDRRSRSRSPRGGGGGRRVSLLVRNLAFDTRADEIKRLFDKYGEVKDVYIPMNFYTKEPQGFAFVEFYDEKDAEYAKRKLDREFLNGREIAVIFAKQQRKRPDDMRKLESRRRSRSPRRNRSRSGSRGKGGGGGGRDRSRSRDRAGSASPRRRSISRSPAGKASPSPAGNGGGAEVSSSPPPARSPSRSPPPRDDRDD